jgi:hypothetical protein
LIIPDYAIEKLCHIPSFYKGGLGRICERIKSPLVPLY